MSRVGPVDRRSVDGGGLDDPRRLGAGRARPLSRTELRRHDPVVLAPRQRQAIADQPRRNVALLDLPRRRVFQATPAESWRSAIRAYAGFVVAAIAWLIVLVGITAVDPR